MSASSVYCAFKRSAEFSPPRAGNALKPTQRQVDFARSETLKGAPRRARGFFLVAAKKPAEWGFFWSEAAFHAIAPIAQNFSLSLVTALFPSSRTFDAGRIFFGVSGGQSSVAEGRRGACAEPFTQGTDGLESRQLCLPESSGKRKGLNLSLGFSRQRLQHILRHKFRKPIDIVVCGLFYNC